MATIKEKLHLIVDGLSEERAEAVLAYLNGEVGGEALEDRGRKSGALLVAGRAFFSKPPRTWQQLAAEQGVAPVASVDEVIGDFWPQDESIDGFLAAVREWRRDG